MTKVRALVKQAENIKSVCEADGAVDSGKNLSALMVASLFGQLDVVKHLVSHGFDPLKRDPRKRSSYVLAAMGNHIAVVDFYWAQGNKPSADDPFIGTILWSAGLWARDQILAHYLGKGADVNASHFGYTALAAAAQSGHLKTVKYLIARGAKVRGAGIKSALEAAQSHKRPAVVEFLQGLNASGKQE